MPIVDKERGVLIVRVVYDGPPLSGKTTTLRALAAGLGVAITSPAEQDGRTLFFDWVDYVGGLFGGRQIRCQIVSVPGQRELAERRRVLLEAADAIVMVGDTRAGAIESTYALLRDVLPWCRAQDPPVGVVIQANKRDAPDAVPRTAIHEEFERIAPIAIIDTVATTGEGVREAFVFAVRLALDRVRTLAAARRLREGAPDVDSASELYSQMERLSVAPLPPAADTEAVRPVVALENPTPEAAPSAPVPEALPELAHLADSRSRSEPTVTVELEGERLFTPDPMMPGGFIWPPVDGRMLLHEVARLARRPVRTPAGDWWASGEGWRFHSSAASLFSTPDRGRHELIEWARLHAANQHRLSPGRTVILADAGGGRFRLWQLVRVSPALRERLVAGSTESSDDLARELLIAALHLLRARRAFQGSELRLPCTLWTVSSDVQQQPSFVGLMPRPGVQSVEDASDSMLLEREFRPLFQGLAAERSDFRSVVSALGRARSNGGADVVDELVRLASHS